VKFAPAPRSNASKELVTAPVIAVPFVAVDDAEGCIVTVDVFTLGFRGSPLLDIPWPDTEYSHPVL